MGPIPCETHTRTKKRKKSEEHQEKKIYQITDNVLFERMGRILIHEGA
jgi:hypothetical protein